MSTTRSSHPIEQALAELCWSLWTELGVAGVFTHDMAATKVQAATDAAEQQDYPLLVTMEPDSQESSE